MTHRTTSVYAHGPRENMISITLPTTISFMEPVALMNIAQLSNAQFYKCNNYSECMHARTNALIQVNGIFSAQTDCADSACLPQAFSTS